MKTKTSISFGSILIIIVLASGCNTTPTQYHAPQTTTKQPEDVAMVNGAPIKQDKLVQLLLPAYGKTVLQEIILLEVVRQQALAQGINITEQMKQDELTKLLNDMAPNKSTREQMALFNYMLQKRNLSSEIFDLIIEKQALLRQMVKPDVDITQEMLTQEYQRQHGKRLIVRQIVTSSFRSITEANKLLQAGRPFAEIVQQLSQDQQSLVQDGLSQPFSIADNNIPQPLRDKAFDLEHIGQVSDTFRYTDDKNMEWWCLIKLEKIIPADNIDMASVKEQLAETLRRITISKRIFDLQESLRKKAKITILEPKLQ